MAEGGATSSNQDTEITDEHHATLGIFPIQWTSNVQYLPPINTSNLTPVSTSKFTYETYLKSKSPNKIGVSALHRKQRHTAHSLAPISRVNIPDDEKLRIAARGNRCEAVSQLLRTGCNPRSADSRERSALHFAAANGYVDVVKLLLQHGADPNQKDRLGNTPLHLAVCCGHIDVVMNLLKSGPCVAATDNGGRTPLHLARARLRTLHDDIGNCTPSKLRQQCLQLVDMMKQYLLQCPTTDGNSVDELTGLCDKMSLASTRTEMDNLSELLTNFTEMKIELQNQIRETKPA